MYTMLHLLEGEFDDNKRRLIAMSTDTFCTYLFVLFCHILHLFWLFTNISKIVRQVEIFVNEPLKKCKKILWWQDSTPPPKAIQLGLRGILLLFRSIDYGDACLLRGCQDHGGVCSIRHDFMWRDVMAKERAFFCCAHYGWHLYLKHSWCWITSREEISRVEMLIVGIDYRY